jgi:hypothetical protein
MRGAVRLFFIITPTLIIFSSYLVVKIFDYLKSKDKIIKLLFLGAFILVILMYVLDGYFLIGIEIFGLS